MILGAKINNFLGIRAFKLDFKQKNAKNKGQEEQILTFKDKGKEQKFALVPSFLAKNAAGKTSFIKAITFTLSFSTLESFRKEISFYIFYTLSEYIINDNMRNHSLHLDSNEIMVNFNEEIIAHQIIKNLFYELSYSGTSLIDLEIELTKNRKIKLELSKDNFIIKLNDEIIDVLKIIVNILGKVFINKFISNPFMMRKEILLKINDYTSDINFFENVLFNSIFRDSSRKSTSNELLTKHKVDKYIKNLVDTFGFEPIKILLKKMDTNIVKISFDIAEKNVDIFIKESEIPIKGKNLSFGTQKVLEILYKSAPLFKNGGIMLIDEIENGLHLSLIKLIVSFFENEDINYAGAQLFLTTHNPLIFENNIIQPFNVYMNENDNFINIKKMGITKRTEHLIKVIKTKNYFNDLFWTNQKHSTKSTLSNIAISQIINAISDNKRWQ